MPKRCYFGHFRAKLSTYFNVIYARDILCTNKLHAGRQIANHNFVCMRKSILH